MMIELHNDRRQEEMLHNLMMTRVRRPDTSGPLSGLPAVVAAIVGFAVRVYTRRKVYNQLAVMSDRMLADIGLSRADIGFVAEVSARKAGADAAGHSEKTANSVADVVAFRTKAPAPSLVIERDAA